MELELKGGVLSLPKGEIRQDEPLCQHTYFRIGGPCKALISPLDAEELKKILDFARTKGVKYFIIGRGSNLLVKDEGFDGLAIRLSESDFSSVRFSQDEACVGSGMKLSRFCELLAEAGLSGLEFLSGIPGTVGGAAMMNAGGKFGSIGERIEQVKVMDPEGEIRFLTKSDLKFGYRSSNLEDMIILEARFSLERDEETKILRRIKSFRDEKKSKQDLSSPSAGCVFKNPRGTQPKSAGELIELSGLKGKTIGGARVSEAHANFIINTGDAKASDVLELMDIIQKKVETDHGIRLEPEVKVI